MLGEWSQPGEALPEALADALLDLIDAGFVPAGAVLPPQRACAATLQVSRQTVAEAFGILEAAGHIAALVGSGTRVRSGRAAVSTDGRLFSFSEAAPGLIDLSTGALPASEVVRRVRLEDHVDLDEYFDTDGYFPAGLPILRAAIAERLTRDGVPTVPQQIVVTNGAQHASYLASQLLVSAGDTVLVEEPTYRGELAELRLMGARVKSVPLTAAGLALDLVDRGLRRAPAMFYCQTSIHNPTGLTMAPGYRKALAALLDHHGVPVVEDCCSYDLTTSGLPAPMLAGEMGDDLVLTIGTLSKLFWGGLRIGWLRASSTRIRQLIERRKAEDLASPISTQVVATNLMTHVGEARRERRALFKPAGGQHVRLLATCFRRGCGPHHKVGLVCGPILTMTPQLWLKLRNEWGFDWLRGRDIRLMTGSGQCCGFLSGMNRSRSRKHWECCAEPSLIGDDAD